MTAEVINREYSDDWHKQKWDVACWWLIVVLLTVYAAVLTYYNVPF